MYIEKLWVDIQNIEDSFEEKEDDSFVNRNINQITKGNSSKVRVFNINCTCLKKLARKMVRNQLCRTSQLREE